MNVLFKKCLLLIACIASGIYAAAPCVFETGINCPTECDNPSRYKTCDGDVYAKTFFSYRPQDSDSSRRIIGWFNADYRKKKKPLDRASEIIFDADGKKQVVSSKSRKVVDWFNQDYKDDDTQHDDIHTDPRFVLHITPQYTRSFNTQGLGAWFFFNGCNAMTVGIPGPYGTFDIDASQIGLSLGTLFNEELDTVQLVEGKIGTVTAKPIVENYIVDVDFWYDLSAWHKNLWSRIEFPIVYMKTNMQMQSTGKGVQTDEYPLGLFSLESTIVDVYNDQVCGTTPVPYNSIVCALQGDQGWGAVAPLQFGKFPSHTLHKWGVAGLHFDLGYDIYDTFPWYCAGSLHIVFPTGNRSQGRYMLEPIIGANKSWQFGATAIAHYIKSLERWDDTEIGIYLYGVGTHLFKSAQSRVFSLVNNGPGSQLLLLKQFNVDITGLVGIERTANILCGRTKIGSTLMFDGSLMFQFSHKQFVADVGYNFWVRTKEHRSKSVSFRGFFGNTFGIKGDTAMQVQVQVPVNLGPIQCITDTSTDSTGTIAVPTLPDPPNDSQVTEENPGSIFLTPSDINLGIALQPTAMTNKLFSACGYKSTNWFALISGEVEFATNNAALNQWGVALKVGGYF